MTHQGRMNEDSGVSLTDISPEEIALDLCDCLGPTPENKLTPEQRRFWMTVGERLGTEYIKAFRHVGALMAKVEEF